MKPPQLPKFDSPPVNEVSLSVQFAEIPELNSVHLASLWREGFDTRYPRVEEHPRIELPIEDLSPSPRQAKVQIELLRGHPGQRLFFIDESGTELVQVQRDFFGRNWRRHGQGVVYPEYDNLRVPFAEDFRSFVDYVEGRKIGSVAPKQCEVTYVNHVPADAHPPFSNPGRILGPIARDFDSILGSPLDDVGVNLSFLLAGGDSSPVGRLRVSLVSGAHSATLEPVYQLTLTARVACHGPDAADTLACLDRAHEAVVCGFRDITTPEMHETWRIRR